jgi:hypothetical protein
MLTVELHAAGGGDAVARGQVLDLRKRGLVPVPGSLQLPGVIHHMTLRAHVAGGARVLARLEVEQPAVAFEPSESTGGESCRDPAPALQALVGRPLDDALLPALSACFGGPRGCTHLLTLARLLASAVRRALALEAALAGPPRREGERFFRRSLTVDGFELPGRAMQVAVQLGDVHLVRGAPADSFDRLARQTEVRALAALDVATTTLRELRLEERERGRAALDVPFADRSEGLQDLIGRPLMGGLGASLVARFGGRPEDAPLLDALLALAPGYVQCVAALSDLFLPGGRVPTGSVGAGLDSCFMWRSGGALQARRGGA